MVHTLEIRTEPYSLVDHVNNTLYTRVKVLVLVPQFLDRDIILRCTQFLGAMM